jgi:hypothetical protein
MSIAVGVPSLKAPEQYRRLAREAVRNAEAAPSLYFRLSYLSLATGWRALADEAERAVGACVSAEIVAARNLWPEQRAD